MDIYLPLLTALVTGIVVGGISIVGIYIQAKSNERSERLRQAAFLAVEDYKLRLSLIEKYGGERLPLVTSLDYYVSLMQAIEKGDLSPAVLKGISDQNSKTIDAIKQLVEMRNRAEQGR